MQNTITGCYQTSTSFIFQISNQNNLQENESIFNAFKGNETIQSEDIIEDMKLKMMDLANLVDYMRLVMMKFSILKSISELIKNILT